MIASASEFRRALLAFVATLCVSSALPTTVFAQAVVPPAARSDAAACPLEPQPCCAFGARRKVGDLRLGFQLWPTEIQRWQARIVALAPRIVRFSIGPYWRDAPAISVEASLDEVRRFVTERILPNEAIWRAGADNLKAISAGSGPIEELLIVWEPPLTDLDSPDLRQRGSRRVVNPAAVTAHARAYLAIIEAARRLGHKVDAVEIANEPDGAWNMAIPPATYVALIEALRREAASAGVDLPRIAGPGLAFLSAMHAYLSDRPLAQRMLRSLDVVSAHAWDDRLGRDVLVEAQRARALLDDLGWRAPIMISEFAPTYPEPSDRAAKRGPDQRRAVADERPLVNELPRYAPSTMELALGLAAAGYNPIIYWELIDTEWGTTSYGLLDRAGGPRAAYAAWANLAALTARTRIDGVAPETQLGKQVFGLFDDGRLRAVGLLNRTTTPFGIRADNDRKDWAPEKTVSTTSPAESAQSPLGTCQGPGGRRVVLVPQSASVVIKTD